jgi:DNA polymerase elongation subunit (family B)
MQVHIYDCLSRDERIIKETESEKEVEYLSAYDSDHGKKPKTSYNDRKTHHMVIHLFGMDANGQAMRIDVNGFRPFFYVDIGSLPDYTPIEKQLRTKLRTDVDLIEFKMEYHQKFYSYTGGKSFRFLKMSFQSLSMFYTVRKEFLDDKQGPKMSIKGGKPLDVYESNIDPMLRFFHMRGISPCGWAKVTGTEVESESGMRLQCDWKDIGPGAGGVAPLLHAFWDIECYSHSGEFPQALPAKKSCLEAKLCGKTKCANCQANGGDPIIQIGTTLWSHSLLERHIFVLDTCDPVEGVTVHVCKTEKELIIGWCQMMIDRNVNVFVGYNIFGFDEKYLWERLTKFGLEQDDAVQGLSLLAQEGKEMKLEEKRLSSSALGDNFLHMWTTPGRLRIDLLGHIKRKAQLPSYKLDSVAGVYLSGKLSGFEQVEGRRWLIKVSKKEKGDARVGRAVQLLDDLGEDLTEKMVIQEIVSEGFIVEVGEVDEDLRAVANGAARWAVTKDDVSPQDIFRLHRGSAADRAIVAAYCVQDCDLTLELYKKLDVFNEAMAMANVCWVPVSYIFTRGQGIKIESLIFEYCMGSKQLIKVLPSSYGEGVPQEDSYEGAIVLTPTPGFYTDPVGVCDFSSLYPSTIISENISHDSLVWAKDYDMDGKLVCVSYGSVDDERWAPTGTQWTDIEFDILRPDPEDTRKHPVKRKVGVRHCRYAQPVEGKGSLPKIVAKLLAARKATRAMIPKTDDPFKKALLDAEQNAYKVTANSLYGQLGSPTFKIRLQNLAASVTAYGRKQIIFSKEAIEQFYGPAAADPRCSAEIVYGDTDSIFVSFNPKNPATGEALTGREAREATKALTEEVGAFITGALKAPHDFEYDKIFSPFIIFSKKRYVGNKYEDSIDDFKETSMGIVLKRRDNAPLLKMTYGAAIDRLLNHQDVPGAVAAVKAKVRDLVEGRMKLSQLTITKSLRSEYKSTPPAHKVLANRIAERDPGNAPASGERIGYVYVQALAGQLPSKLQGDRVETPAWIEKHGLKPDFEYYIDHQLYNPIAQLFSIMVEKMPGFTAPTWATDPDKLIGQREALAGRLLFEEGLSACRNAAKRSFVSKMFAGAGAATAGTATPVPAPNPRTRAAPVDNTMAAAEAAAFGAGGGAKKLKQQSIMSAFAIDTALMSDERLAREMRAVKAKRKTNSKADVAT